MTVPLLFTGLRKVRLLCMFSLLFTLLLIISVSDASFLSQPKVQWTTQIDGSGTLSGRGLRRGNEVFLDDATGILFVTADDGSLHLIDTSNNNNQQQEQSSIVFVPDTVTGTYTESTSAGVTLVRDATTTTESEGVEYAIYAVVDVPVKAGVVTYNDLTLDPSRTVPQSRLLAVNLDGSLRWSLDLNGIITGKPVLGGTTNNILYVVHNTPINTEETTDGGSGGGDDAMSGQISVIRLHSTDPVVTASLAPATDRNGPLGPPAGTTMATVSGQRQDVIVVSEAWNNGYLSVTNNRGGNVYVLKPSTNPSDESTTATTRQGNSDAYEFTLLSDWSLPSVTRPAVTQNAEQIFVGATGANLGGWNDVSGVVSGEGENLTPAWDLTLEPNKGNASQPLLVPPVLSSDGTVLYQVGASTELYCIEAESGRILWKEDGGLRSVIVAEPRLVERADEDAKLYVIESMTGELRQHDALTGDIEWRVDCNDVTGIPSCSDAVEADFSLSSDGNMIYYGDIFGKIHAIQIADFKDDPVTPTKDETLSPITSSPIAEEDISTTGSPTFAPASDIPVIDLTTAPPKDTDIDSDMGSGAVVLPTESSTQIDANAAITEDSADVKDFFVNNLLIILIAVCGGLALAIVIVMLAQRARKGKAEATSKDNEVVLNESDEKGFAGAQNNFEDECRRDEEEFLASIPKTPEKPGQRLVKPASKNHSPAAVTPATLASIEESPAECELSFASGDDSAGGAPSPKKLDTTFVAVGLPTATKKEKTDNTYSSSLLKTAISEDEELVEALNDNAMAPEATVNSSMCSNVNAPQDLESVEVIASSGGSVISHQSGRKSSTPVADPNEYYSASNDLMSVDGSMYLDDDSMFQSKIEVASLANYSVASSTQGGASELDSAHYTAEDGQIKYVSSNGAAPTSNPYLQPDLEALLSPEVAAYLRKNQNISPNPMTPTPEYVASSTKLRADSPMTPISPMSDTGKLPSDCDGRILARSGSSARRSACSGQRRSIRELSPADQDSGNCSSSSNSVSPSPETHVKTNAEPVDAWSSFLNELAKAESEFFNPSFSSKTMQGRKQERTESSPPPPPPPESPPPELPSCDTQSKKTQLL